MLDGTFVPIKLVTLCVGGVGCQLYKSIDYSVNTIPEKGSGNPLRIWICHLEEMESSIMLFDRKCDGSLIIRL